MARATLLGNSRGVDLSNLRDRSQHQHRWVITGMFVLDDKTLAGMASRRLQIANLVAQGKENEIADRAPAVPIEMGAGNILRTDGPGCLKCSAHWENLLNGWGKECRVSDEDFQRAKEANDVEVQKANEETMNTLIDRARRGEVPVKGGDDVPWQEKPGVLPGAEGIVRDGVELRPVVDEEYEEFLASGEELDEYYDGDDGDSSLIR